MKGLTRRYHSTYESYKGAVRRCKPDYENRRYYFDRGIRFLFSGFDHFLAVMGPRPDGLTLDRIDNDGNYEPGNCRWVTMAKQNSNKRQRQAKPKPSPEKKRSHRGFNWMRLVSGC